MYAVDRWRYNMTISIITCHQNIKQRDRTTARAHFSVHTSNCKAFYDFIHLDHIYPFIGERPSLIGDQFAERRPSKHPNHTTNHPHTPINLHRKLSASSLTVGDGTAHDAMSGFFRSGRPCVVAAARRTNVRTITDLSWTELNWSRDQPTDSLS